ncbi:MAG: hypothetical protein J5960_06770 [Desulfovibrio sp.]|nr:hypothetical protein [Desulfovibrio sp.]
MDSRTRKKLLAQFDALAHMIHDHDGVLPAGKAYADIFADGMKAATALAMPKVQREAQHPRRAVAAQDCEANRLVSQTPPEVRGKMPTGLGMAALLPGFNPSETWGIGRSLPRGDVQ